MIALFEPLRFGWSGKEFELQPTLKLIAEVESVVTATELYGFAGNGAFPIAKISMAFGILIRAAGGKATDGEIYQAMFSSGQNAENAANAVAVLLAMMAPKTSEDEAGKK